MLIAYFDEVKYQKGGCPFYWLGAIVASADLIWTLEGQVNALAEQVFGTRMLRRDTEFHAADVFNGHEHFKGWDLDRKLDVLKKLTSIFGSAQGLGKICIKIDVAKVKFGIDIEATAFMYLTERVNSYLVAQKLPGLLIGDRENETVAGKFAQELSQYRAGGTKYQFGQKLDHLLDTVHFTHSHHSRMLQLADLYVWLLQFRAAGDRGKDSRKQVIDHVKTIDSCLAPNRYKDWPTSNSWA